MGNMSRSKGKRGELEVVQAFRRLGLTANRTSPLQAGSMNMPDVRVHEFPALWIEVKRKRSPSMRAAFLQAQRECGKDDIPVACTRADNEPWLATLPLAALVELVSMIVAEPEVSDGDA